MKKKFLTNEAEQLNKQLEEAIELLKKLYYNCDFTMWEVEDFLNKLEE